MTDAKEPEVDKPQDTSAPDPDEDDLDDLDGMSGPPISCRHVQANMLCT
jgi:hypothetical protein